MVKPTLLSGLIYIIKLLLIEVKYFRLKLGPSRYPAENYFDRVKEELTSRELL
jgi:hypothetical protein